MRSKKKKRRAFWTLGEKRKTQGNLNFMALEFKLVSELAERYNFYPDLAVPRPAV